MTAVPAGAHATLSSSSPADGAVLAALPPAVTLTFDAPGRYTAVTAPSTAAGRWLIRITVPTGDIDETAVQLSQTIR
ncbi:MAG TPA: copper resistance protein CopC [Actinoallomurus sp.]|nr:copper resistance protein CopC [Actinoallomurus sp.]